MIKIHLWGKDFFRFATKKFWRIFRILGPLLKYTTKRREILKVISVELTELPKLDLPQKIQQQFNEKRIKLMNYAADTRTLEFAEDLDNQNQNFLNFVVSRMEN